MPKKKKQPRKPGYRTAKQMPGGAGHGEHTHGPGCAHGHGHEHGPDHGHGHDDGHGHAEPEAPQG